MDYQRKNLELWGRHLNDVFGGAIPRSCVWDTAPDIAKVLRGISGPDLCRVFLPLSGGSNLTGAKVSTGEEGCIELSLGTPVILMPRILTFERVTRTREWAYFWLEADRLDPRFPRETKHEELEDLRDPDVRRRVTVEDLVEVRSGHYEPASYTEPDEPDDDQEETSLALPSRRVSRYLQGAFVITANGSPYNSGHEPYDALHERYGASGFKTQMKLWVAESLRNEARIVFPERGQSGPRQERR